MDGATEATLEKVFCIDTWFSFRKINVGFGWPWQEALLDLDKQGQHHKSRLYRETRAFRQKYRVRAQKVDGTTLSTYAIVVVAFSVTDQANCVKILEKTFLIAND